ncbi:protein phosphatase 2C domain-containing protein [Myxococcota bacterium]|nr:protein phosphatase 2C domain-containing protein [Myxococcota bacterium]
MLTVRDPARLCTGDVLIHPTRGAAVVDEADASGAWVELTERLDRSHGRLSASELADGWRQAAPGGLFEQSVLRTDEAAAKVGDNPGETLHMLVDELGVPVDRELAATWLVSRGLLAPGRSMAWWAEALEAASGHPELVIDGQERVRFRPDASRPSPDDPRQVRQRIATAGARLRFELIEGMGMGPRQSLLELALAEGDLGLAGLLVRWPGSISPRMHARIDRLLSSGHRGLAQRVAQAEPALAAPALLSDARTHGPDGLAGEVVAALPPRRRAHLLMELLSASLEDTDALDLAEGLIEEHGGLQSLQDRVAPHGDVDPDAIRPPPDGRWASALQWLAGRSADTTMEMPSLHPTPLLRETGRIAARDAFAVALSAARALARRHAEGRAGGLRSARLLRVEWKVELGPAEPSTPADDVRDAMRTVLDLLVGRLPAPATVDDETLLAHLASLVPDLSPDFVAVATRALAGPTELRPADGLSLWMALEVAQARSRVRELAPPRLGLDLEVGFDTHIGAMKARLGQTNQDALFFHHQGPLTLLVLGDGISISSAGSGNLASALLVQAVASLWEERADGLASADDDRIYAFLEEALARANTAVCEAAWKLAGGDLRRHVPMGTTAILALLRNGVAYMSALGDSRAYLVTSSGCAQLTGDGNLCGDWLRTLQAGQPMELEHDGGALTSYVGHFDEHDRPSAILPQQRAVTLLPGEHLLLCTDGLTDYAAAGAGELAALVEDTLAGAPSASQACRELVARANAGGGGDNVSMLLVRVPG